MGYCCILSSFYNRLIFYDDTTTTKPWDWDDENLKSPLKNREELVSASDLKVPTQNYSFHPSCQCFRSACVFLIHRKNGTDLTDNIFILDEVQVSSISRPDLRLTNSFGTKNWKRFPWRCPKEFISAPHPAVTTRRPWERARRSSATPTTAPGGLSGNSTFKYKY